MNDPSAYLGALKGNWNEVFFDTCTEDWQQRWQLDGEIAAVRNSPQGMQLTAGPQAGNDAHHMTLWTRESFKGDVKIEFDYTRLDFEHRFVNILYIQATGSGHAPHSKDIMQWSDLRKVPAMRCYFDHMHTYHVSYAAFSNAPDASPDEDYIRARRYIPRTTAPEKNDFSGLQGTDLKPDYFRTGLFTPGVPHHFTFIKRHDSLSLCIKNSETTCDYHWKTNTAPPITEGRIGIRHMFARSARYKNFRISQPT